MDLLVEFREETGGEQREILKEEEFRKRFVTTQEQETVMDEEEEDKRTEEIKSGIGAQSRWTCCRRTEKSSSVFQDLKKSG